MNRKTLAQHIINKYPYPLQVDRDAHPNPHKVQVPYDFGYLPINKVGKFYMFLTPQDRDDFVKRYALKKRTIKQWPPEKYS